MGLGVCRGFGVLGSVINENAERRLPRCLALELRRGAEARGGPGGLSLRQWVWEPCGACDVRA